MILLGLNYVTLYTEDDINMIKGDSEVTMAAAHSKIRVANPRNNSLEDIKIVCKNRRLQGCPFELTFEEAQPSYFLLSSMFTQHDKCCHFDEETLAFYDSRNKLIKLKPWLTEFIRRKDSQGNQQKPIKLLRMVNQELTGGKYSITQIGVKTAENKIKLKKKFDNIVNEIRREARRQASQTIKYEQMPWVIYHSEPCFISPMKAYMPSQQPTIRTSIKQEMVELPECLSPRKPIKLEYQPSEFSPLNIINTPIRSMSKMRSLLDPSPMGQYTLNF